ncbi:zinc metalloprotease HtpX [Clostridium beijerinckii]|jgi:Heat shock protein. Metallo peptidase. MEROPS family M48B|uniref:Protease HtpX homolog n=2 Tax=Clostridium beijerinckii TaxID=1520 RepID=A0AAE2V2G9_CLOBE|nr:zinc metalloprotease HtpX [Clostridium beijerinckii]ABR34380.1 peptidase M48, Ste24p [Clostridium beijerinckii NCIMB 8052]AIU03005.1 peptidase M48, Ste24p [Clostridium beijerinckii ATCC 35702]MBF7811002.1 zinc metalloprotease HtpX [Clostridium beijerinckii]NRT24306.1 heat shock protein HtpX [Clostridium beijerinckii]NRT68104.1 heat shock protein HtpX [Clostridium beijerinckii]
MSSFGNQIKTLLLMSVLTILVVLIGRGIGGQSGMLMALVLALVMNGGSYWFSDKIALSITGAKPLTRNDNIEIYNMVERLTANAGIPMPRLYITASTQPNAFATGRNPKHSAVAVTQGLLNILNYEELEGVIAHELAHIKNRDVLISTIAAVMAGVITTMANWAQWALMFGMGNSDEEEGSGFLAALPLIILGPIAAMLVQMAVSRSREYLADSTGARIAGHSRGLSNALLKLDQASRVVPMDVNPAVSHMFIVNPLSAQRLMNLFSTHPTIEDRVRRLQNSNL